MDPIESVNARVRRLPEELRRQFLRRAGKGLLFAAVDGGAAGQAAPPPDYYEVGEGGRQRWGFPTNLPSRHRLAEYLEQQAAQQQAAQQQAAQQQQQPELKQQAELKQQDAEAGPREVQNQYGQQDQQQAQQAQRPILLELLQQSRTFQSPDCADAMAEALGVADLFRGLRGSVVCEAPPDAEVQQKRAALRAALRLAWSHEALRRGVALAKAGDLAGALPCYDQALQLEGGNADALVARGAAHANQHQWQRASDDLEAALQLQPSHANARQYLDAVQAKAEAAGLRLLPPLASTHQALLLPTANGQAQGEREYSHTVAAAGAAQAAGGSGGSRGAEALQQRLKEEGGSAAAHRSSRKRRRGGSSDDSRSGSRSRGQVQSRGMGRQRRRRRRRSVSPSADSGTGSSTTSCSSSGGSGSSSSSGGADSDADRLAAAAAAAAQPDAGGAAAAAGAMDVAKALQIVTSHYKSRRSKKERRKAKKPGKRHKQRRERKPDHKKRRKHKKR